MFSLVFLTTAPFYPNPLCLCFIKVCSKTRTVRKKIYTVKSWLAGCQFLLISKPKLSSNTIWNRTTGQRQKKKISFLQIETVKYWLVENPLFSTLIFTLIFYNVRNVSIYLKENRGLIFSMIIYLSIKKRTDEGSYVSINDVRVWRLVNHTFSRLNARLRNIDYSLEL